jgi:thioredoxin 1
MEPTREQVDAMPGLVLLEFGASWCPHCQVARPLVDAELARRPEVRHFWIEDARGKKLGRTFTVKLWPTLVLLRDGKEIARLVRPRSAREIESAFAQLAA